MQSIGGFGVSIILLLVIDSLGKKKVLLFSEVLLCFFLLSIGFRLQLYALYVAFLILGFFTGMVNTLSPAVMAQIVPVHTEKYINFMHMIFSFGSVVTPIISSIIFSAYSLSGVFYILGGFSFVCAFYSIIVFKHDTKEKLLIEKINLKEKYNILRKVLKIPGIKEVGWIMALTSCWQLTAIYYISSLFTSLTGKTSIGALTLSVLFLSMMISRLLYSKVASRFLPGRMLAFGSLIGAVLWVISMLILNIYVKIVFVGLAAFCCANNYPILFSKACKISPKNTGIALGIETLGYYLALFIFSPIIGLIGGTIGLNNALLLLAIPLFSLVPIALNIDNKKACTRDGALG